MNMPARLPEAMKFHAAGELERAQGIYTDLLNEYPGHAEILFLLGTSYLQQRNFSQARLSLEKAIAREPKNPKLYYRLVDILVSENNFEEALEVLAKLFEQAPGEQQAYEKILAIATAHQLFHQAVRAMRPAAKKHGGELFVAALMAKLLLEIGENADSIGYFEKVLFRAPTQGPDFFQCYARALHRGGKGEKARRVVEEALKEYPASRDLYLQRANNYGAEGNFEQQLESYRRGFAANPGDAEMQNSLALMEFLTSDFREGFGNYRARFNLKDQAYFPFPVPEWQGENVAGKNIIIWAEQGVGDVIMFATFLPWLLAQEPAKVLLLCHPNKLIPLMARSFPAVTVEPLFAKHPEDKWTGYDCHVPMGELLRYGLDHYTPAEHEPFLKADREKSQALREQYQKADSTRPYLVGIAWHTVNPATGYLRNIPLKHWKQLFDVAGVQFVSLQYAHPNAMDSFDQEVLSKHILLDESFASYEDMDTLLAQIDAMDEVITIQNATAHMAGALGKKTTLLLSRASDWRWGREREDNRWYPNLRILRQPDTYRWERVMLRAREELEKR